MVKKLAELQTQLAQLQKQVSRQELLNKIVQAMRGTLVLDEILQITVNQLRDAFGVSRCLILRPKEGKPELVCHVLADTSGDGGEDFIGVSCNFCSYHYQTLARGKLAFVSNIGDSLPTHIKQQCEDSSVQAILAAPLQYQKSYLGAIGLHQCDRSREWSVDELIFVQEVAGHCSVAIHQAQLYQQLQIELAERQRAESQLQASLQQKEVLLS
ncbi:MAG: GAF domain-containing protein, partial [Symploca sp. SIO1C4]|nr:GAF domain-containing protein [Symploca sp. SIO1C4]